MENITLFASIVIIVFGVLQIVLFFKLWEMTNDVKIIKDKKESEGIDILLNEAQIYNLSNNKEDAFESYKKHSTHLFLIYTIKQREGIQYGYLNIGKRTTPT